jgi:hypothetical protein
MLCSAMRKIQLKQCYQLVGSKFNPTRTEYFNRALRIHITEQQYQLDFTVTYPIILVNKCKIIYR